MNREGYWQKKRLLAQAVFGTKGLWKDVLIEPNTDLGALYGNVRMDSSSEDWQFSDE